ncbi:Hypothetical protein SCF082_LOCUS38438, partial [Durusdinium trenchii]
GDVPRGLTVASHYGALDEFQDAEAAKLAKSKRRRRVNCVPLLLALLLPWLVFVFCFALAAFVLHYAAPLSTTLCELAIIAGCLSRIPWAHKSWKRGAAEGFYPVYITAAVLFAAIVGWVMGDFTFYAYMEPSYSATMMASYVEVDPSSTRLADGQVVPTDGGRFQDAGQVYFNHDTVLDLNRSYSFKLADVYCVAPIWNQKCREPCGADFWAVGKNCCSEDPRESSESRANENFEVSTLKKKSVRSVRSLLVVRPGAASSVRSLLVAMPFAPSSVSTLKCTFEFSRT